MVPSILVSTASLSLHALRRMSISAPRGKHISSRFFSSRSRACHGYGPARVLSRNLGWNVLVPRAPGHSGAIRSPPSGSTVTVP